MVKTLEDKVRITFSSIYLELYCIEYCVRAQYSVLYSTGITFNRRCFSTWPEMSSVSPALGLIPQLLWRNRLFQLQDLFPTVRKDGEFYAIQMSKSPAEWGWHRRSRSMPNDDGGEENLQEVQVAEGPRTN